MRQRGNVENRSCDKQRWKYQRDAAQNLRGREAQLNQLLSGRARRRTPRRRRLHTSLEAGEVPSPFVSTSRQVVSVIQLEGDTTFDAVQVTRAKSRGEGPDGLVVDVTCMGQGTTGTRSGTSETRAGASGHATGAS